jgi:OTU domain-containing protein 6
MMEVRSDLSPFIDEDFDVYVAAMRQPHVWGGEPELSVAAHVLKRPIHVFDNRLKPLTQYAPTQKSSEGSAAQPVCLLFQRLGHYDLLVAQKQKAFSKM